VLTASDNTLIRIACAVARRSYAQAYSPILWVSPLADAIRGQTPSVTAFRNAFQEGAYVCAEVV
jgi:hypothetical protein